jgi:proton-dependent oligopeptide transporter, POT family
MTAFEKRFGHPPGLFVLCFTEMWERFSYYGMRTLLILYMGRYLFLDGHREHVLGHRALYGVFASVMGKTADIDSYTSQMYGLYTGLVYLTPVLGGYLADRFWGQRRTVVIGGLLMAAGNFLMVSERFFYIALLLLIIGNGAFKPNISTQVGGLYPEGDDRRDRAFSIFYVGINLGAFFQFIAGFLAERHGAQLADDPTTNPNPAFNPADPGAGWHWGFASVGVGMLIGLAFYLWGQRYLAADNVMKRESAAKQPSAAIVEPKKPLTSAEKKTVWALILLCALNIVFWAVYEQQGNTMQLWATDSTVWPSIMGIQTSSTLFQSFNPFMIFFMTPIVTALWKRQNKAGKEPSSVAKMAIGCFILGISFVLMIAGAHAIGPDKGARGSLFWPLSCTAMLTIGELYLSPVGLSLVTKASPKRLVSMMMGMWLLSSFFGNYLSGLIGIAYHHISKTAFFSLLTVLGIIAGLAIWAFNKPLKQAIGAENL